MNYNYGIPSEDPRLGHCGCIYSQYLRESHATEHFFVYFKDGNAPFNLDKAIEKTKPIWGRTHGERSVKLIDKKVLGEDETRVFFFLYTTSVYLENGVFVVPYEDQYFASKVKRLIKV